MLTAQEAVELINQYKKVAIVGLSPKEDRPSFRVGNFMKDQGFDITSVNPGPFDEIIGIKNHRSLAELNPGDVDWVDLFVNPTRLMGLLDDIKRLKPKLVWCQLSVVNDEFNAELDKAGIPYIADACPKIELGGHT
jgi:uncharacterized protein